MGKHANARAVETNAGGSGARRYTSWYPRPGSFQSRQIAIWPACWGKSTIGKCTRATRMTPSVSTVHADQAIQYAVLPGKTEIIEIGRGADASIVRTVIFSLSVGLAQIFSVGAPDPPSRKQMTLAN